MKIRSTHHDESIIVLESMFRLFYPVLASFCKKYVKDEEAVRDIIQDIFLNVWDHRSNIDFSVPLHSYLLRLAHNSCINYLQRQKVEKKYLENAAMQLMEMETQYDSFFEQLAADIMQEHIEQVVENLPEQCRIIFRKSRFEGLSHNEIAQALNISVRTVETQIYRALKILKKALNNLSGIIF